MSDRIIKTICTLGPIGTKLPAPGTFGSVLGIILFYVLLSVPNLQLITIFILFLSLFLLGIPLCSRIEILLGKTDPPEVIWDEFTAVPFVYIFCIESLDSMITIITGFLLFRFFDITKPLGIKKLQLLSGGLGVMIDDIVAAVYSACILYFIKSFSLSFIGYQF